MLVEKIIFNLLAFSLFVIMFFKMMRKNDTNYVAILVLQAIGILISFISILFKVNLNALILILVYILSVILPFIILILEKRGMNFSAFCMEWVAKLYMTIGNNKQAKSILINLAEKYPNDYMSHKLLAEIYEKEGGVRRAIDEYVKMIEINKQDYDSYFRISYLLNESDRKEEASIMLENLISKKPDYVEASILLGDILCEQEKYKEALSIYNSALRYSPNNFELYYSMGIAYTLLNDFANAKTCYEKAAIINTLLYNGYYNLGQISLIFGDLDEAEQFFMKSLQGEDVEPDAYYNLAKICMLKGDKENAINYVNMAIELDKTFIKKANEEPIFIPIKSLIRFPIIDEEDIVPRKTNLTKRELKVKKYLEKTYQLVNKLGHNDLKMFRGKNIKTKENEKGIYKQRDD